MPEPHEPLWVFGYGSLIWNPDFPVAERQIARAIDWHRSFCMRSIHHRGTEAKPGLVLMGDPNGSIPGQPMYFRPVFGALGKAMQASSATFVSQAALADDARGKLGPDKTVLAVQNTRKIGEADMILNHARPEITAPPRLTKSAPMANC